MYTPGFKYLDVTSVQILYKASNYIYFPVVFQFSVTGLCLKKKSKTLPIFKELAKKDIQKYV